MPNGVNDSNFWIIIGVIIAVITVIVAIMAVVLQVTTPQLPTTPIFEGGSEIDTDGNYEINWDNSERAIFYILQESGNSSFVNSITVYRGSVKNAYIYGRPNGVYYYRVKGGNEAGESGWSATRRISVSISLPTGSITVASSQTGASIYLDDRYRGSTPQTITAVSPGTHTIELRLEGYEGWSESVQVTAGETAYVDATSTQIPTEPSTGAITVSFSPIGASIYLDDRYRGNTPQTITAVSQGVHNIELRLEGYEDWSERVQVMAGETSFVDATLIHTPTPTPTPTAPATPTTPAAAAAATATATATATPAAAATATPAPTAEEGDNIIVAMDSTSGWRRYQDNMGSTINIRSVPGRTDNGINISYDLTEWGWVLISKEINPKILSEYEGLRFYYKGSGGPNTIELKLIYEDDTTFGVLWHRATVADNWVTLEAPYSEIGCWWPKANCQEYGYRLDLEEVRKIEFAISNKEGDVYGSGWVIIDDVQGITSPSPTPTPTITPIPSPTLPPLPPPIILTYHDFDLDDVCTLEDNYCGWANAPGKAVVYGSMTTDINVPEGASELEVTISISCNGYGEGLSGQQNSSANIRVDGEGINERIDSTMPSHHGNYYRYEWCDTFSNTFNVRGEEEITLIIEMSGGARLDFEEAILTFS